MKIRLQWQLDSKKKKKKAQLVQFLIIAKCPLVSSFLSLWVQKLWLDGFRSRLKNESFQLTRTMSMEMTMNRIEKLNNINIFWKADTVLIDELDHP